MRLGFVSIEDYNNKKAWSGTIYNLYKNLKLKYDDLIPFKTELNLNSLIINLKKIKGRLTNSSYEIHKDLTILKALGSEIDEYIEKNKLDCIFSPGSMNLAFVKSKVKKIIYIDATFINLLNSSDWYKSYSKRKIEEYFIIEKKIFENCDKILVTTDWVKSSLIDDYFIESERIEIIPFGANIDISKINFEKINYSIENKEFNELKLVFIGVDYKRKGLDLVLETVKVINENHNIKCTLSIIGANPKIEKDISKYVKIYGFVDKNTNESFELFQEIMCSSHFFYMPTNSEAFGLVFAEAAAYGLPCITNKIDGPQYIIRHGQTGFLLEKGSNVNLYAKTILDNFNEITYKKLALNSLNEFKTKLNWNTSFEKITSIINDVVK